MSDLDDLEDIAERTNFGHSIHTLFTGPRNLAQRHSGTHCSNGHEMTPENTRWRKSGRDGRRRRICLACDRAAHGFKGIYKERS